MRILHMGIHKTWVIQQLKRYPVKDVLGDFEGTTDEAIQAIKDDPREYFDGCGCPKDSKGRCQGYDK